MLCWKILLKKLERFDRGNLQVKQKLNCQALDLLLLPDGHSISVSCWDSTNETKFADWVVSASTFTMLCGFELFSCCEFCDCVAATDVLLRPTRCCWSTAVYFLFLSRSPPLWTSRPNGCTLHSMCLPADTVVYITLPVLFLFFPFSHFLFLYLY